ncbi:MAG: peptide deformylase, partial [Phycisphaerae bacterium]|nr:peptide deformylase [Phycisphaerae bacterium]
MSFVDLPIDHQSKNRIVDERVGVRIHTYGDEVLREKARRVETIDDALRELAKDMLETMKAEKGVGLAAEQVGRT